MSRLLLVAWILLVSLAQGAAATVQFDLDAPGNKHGVAFKAASAQARFKHERSLIAFRDPRCGAPASQSWIQLRYQTLGGDLFDSGELPVPCSKWIFKGSSYVFSDPIGSAQGLQKIVWKSEALALKWKGAGYVPPPAVEWLEVRLAVGERSFCGRFQPGRNAADVNQGGLVKAIGGGECDPLSTPTPTSTRTFTRTYTPTRTFTQTPTETPVPEDTSTPTETATATPTPTATSTPTPTVSATATSTATPTVAPDIRITGPVHGLFTQSAAVIVAGEILHPLPNAGSMNVYVNGQYAVVHPTLHTFSLAMPLDFESVFNPMEAVLTTDDPTFVARDRVVVIAGPSVPEPTPPVDPNQPAPFPNTDPSYSPMSVALRLNDSAFEALAPVITNLVSVQPSDLVTPGTSMGSFSGFDITVDFCNPSSTPAIDFGSFEFGVDSKPGYESTTITINDLIIHLCLDSSVLDCDGTVTADTMSIYSDYALDPNPTDPEKLQVTQVGLATAGVTQFHIDLSGGLFLCDIIEGLAPLFANLEQEMVNGIQNLINEDHPIETLLEENLNNVSISGPIGDGLGIDLATPMFDVPEDQVGLTLGADTRVLALNPDPASPNLTASYDVMEPFPDFARCYGGPNDGGPCEDDNLCPGGVCDARTPNGLPYHLALAIGTSAFNQLLKGMVETGIMTQVLTELPGDPPTPLTAGFFGALLPPFKALPANTPLEIKVIPSMAPIVTGDPGPSYCRDGSNPGFLCATNQDCTGGGHCVASLAELRLSQMAIQIFSVDGGSETLQMGGVADFSAGIDLAPTGDGLGLSIGTPTSIEVIILDNPIRADEATINALLPVMVSQMLPSLAGSLGGIPIPSFFGVVPSIVEVSRTGEFMSIYMNLGGD